MLTIQKTAAALTDERRYSCQKPRIVAVTQELSCVCYERFQGEKNEVTAVYINQDGESVGKENVVSGPGKAFMADIHVMNKIVYVVWSEWIGDQWALYLRRLPGCGENDGNQEQEREPEQGDSGRLMLASGQGVFHGRLTDDGDRLFVCWDELDGRGRNSIKYTYLKTKDLDMNMGKPCLIPPECGPETVCISDTCQYYRPVMGVTENGTLLAAYDYFDGVAYVTALKLHTDGGWGVELLLSEGDGWSSDISMLISKNTATLTWQEILPKGMVDYWYSDIRIGPDGRLDVDTNRLVHGQIWYAWNRLLQASADNGTPLQVLLTGHNMSQFYIRLRKPGGDWSPAVLATDEIGLEGAMYADGIVREKDLFLFYQHSNCNGHQERMASIRFLAVPYMELENGDDSVLEVRQDEFYRAIPARKKLQKIPKAEAHAWMEKNGYKKQHIWFGDIHGQSNVSDGLGHVDQYYHYALAVTGQDFTALTDHDVFPDVITEAEWEYEKTMADAFHRPGKLATLISYEWTSNEFRYDFGHKNVYYPNRAGRLYHASDSEGMTPDRLYVRLKEAGAMAFPHHPAATWGVVSAATDWDFHDPAVERNVEIFSRHAPFEKSGTESIYAKNKQRLDGKYVQDALARGYRLGFVAGSDSHQLEHGMEGGILGAFMEKLDREDLFRALHEREVYATTGAQMLLSLKVNGQRMGRELELEREEKDITIEISVLALSPVREAALVKNNRDVYCISGTGNTCDATFTDTVESGETDYYYLRVTLEDEHMGWTSPIWVRRRTT